MCVPLFSLYTLALPTVAGIRRARPGAYARCNRVVRTWKPAAARGSVACRPIEQFCVCGASECPLRPLRRTRNSRAARAWLSRARAGTLLRPRIGGRRLRSPASSATPRVGLPGICAGRRRLVDAGLSATRSGLTGIKTTAVFDLVLELEKVLTFPNDEAETQEQIGAGDEAQAEANARAQEAEKVESEVANRMERLEKILTAVVSPNVRAMSSLYFKQAIPFSSMTLDHVHDVFHVLPDTPTISYHSKPTASVKLLRPTKHTSERRISGTRATCTLI
ncbi:hypothetical protein DFH09DRAFT_1481413 [Mycena vulgaris]|nr:hypothetical protein DFH09DRAFT_1481413 [Mycena vulgaris]